MMDSVDLLLLSLLTGRICPSQMVTMLGVLMRAQLVGGIAAH